MKRKSIFITVGICLLFCALGVGLILREPSHCVLCDVPESDVPCLMDLHSGEVCELRVYDETMLDDPTSAYFSFMNSLGNIGYRDTGDHYCKVSLPHDNIRMSAHLFCKDCQNKLQDCRKDHYAVLDTNSLTAYPIQTGHISIGDYAVEISNDSSGSTLTVRIKN